MALRDVNNYTFLKEALIQKFRHINDPKFQTFKGIPYEPMGNPRSIFGRTYGAFRELIDKKGLDLKSYLNIGDKNVLERLYLNLNKDPNLKFLDHPELVQNDPKYELTEQYHQTSNVPTEAATGQTAGEAAPVSPTTQAGGGGTAGGGHRPAGLPPMAIPAGSATMQSVQQGEVAKTMESPQEEAAAKTSVPKAYEKAPKKIASQAGAPAKGAPRPRLQMPRAVSEGFKNSTSALGRSFYRNIGSRIGLNSLVNRMLNIIGGLGGSLGAMGDNPGIPSGGVFGSVRRRVLSGRNGLRFRALFRKTPGLSKLKGFGTGKKVALAFTLFGLFFGFSIFSAIFLPNQTTPTASAGSLLDYTIPFRDTAVIPLDIKSDVKASWPNAKLENWDTIIQKSIAAGWNPAFVLALWIEESGAQGIASYDDALGCSPGQPTTDIDLSLSCLFNNFSAFTNNQFFQFMARYSGGPANNPFSNNPNFPNGIKFWYSRLVPSGPGALTLITATTTLACPAVGEISAPYGFNIPDYPNAANEGCGTLQSCHNGIDIAAAVGTPVKSTVDGVVTTKDNTLERGAYLIITDQTSNLEITLEHLNTIAVNQNTIVKRGDVVGTVGSVGEGSTGSHLHYKVKRGGVLINPFRTLGSSATLNSNVLMGSDNISQNNYSSVPYTGTNWGSCNQ